MTIYALGGVAPALPANGDFWVAPDANVIGNVRLSEAVSVWFGATLRGDNEPIVVGPGSNVQENAVLHTDPGHPMIIGRDCTIGHKAMLHGCRLGDGVLVGMGAIVLNGAVIGAGSLIGAGALITEGKQIPPGSLEMGTPGKVVRQLDAAAQANLLDSARSYRARMQLFRRDLTVVG